MENEKDLTAEINLGEVVKNTSVINYIKASPLETGLRSRLDKILTEDYFYSNFYAHSEKAESHMKQLKKQISYNDADIVILSGNRGCGKTTFMNYFLRQTGFSNILIDFGDNWEPDVGIKKNIVMALNNRIYNDLFPHSGKEPGHVIGKYLELFGKNNNILRLEQIDEGNYFLYFMHKLEHIRKLMLWESDSGSVMEYYEKDIRMHTLDGTIKQVMMLLIFWDIAEKIENNSDNKCLIVFENLDVIYNTKDVDNIVPNLFSIKRELDQINSIDYCNRPIELSDNYILMLVIREDTLSEIQYAVSKLNHFNVGRFKVSNINITGLYHQSNIIEKRFKCMELYLKNHPKYVSSAGFMQVYNEVKSIREILSDPYLNLRFSELFDYDFGASAEVLGSIVWSSEDFKLPCKEQLNLDKGKKDWFVFGFRSKVFRKVFNLFTQEQYFANVQRFEYVSNRKGVICRVSLDRTILLYLYNSINSGGIVPLDILFGELMEFCQENDTVVDALWQMYDMRRNYQWNKLITFVDMRSMTYDELVKEWDAFVSKDSFYRFAGVKITKAGISYLNYILPHFEYYAARCRDGKGKSPFAMTAEEICDGTEFDRLLKDELEEIADCCQKLYLFCNNVFDTMDKVKGQRFSGADFATTMMFPIYGGMHRMYYCERNIYAHINYLDKLRFYIFAVLDGIGRRGGFNKEINILHTVAGISEIKCDICEAWPAEIFSESSFCYLKINNLKEKQDGKVQIVFSENKKAKVPLDDVVMVLKACLNLRLIEAICSFMAMFGFYGKKKCTMYSEDTPRICTALDACIKRIRSAGYIDFTTQIDLHTGEDILKQ